MPASHPQQHRRQKAVFRKSYQDQPVDTHTKLRLGLNRWMNYQHSIRTGQFFPTHENLKSEIVRRIAIDTCRKLRIFGQTKRRPILYWVEEFRQAKLKLNEATTPEKREESDREITRALSGLKSHMGEKALRFMKVLINQLHTESQD